MGTLRLTTMPRILIADDDASVRSSMRRLLVEAGYEVEEARDGDEALEICRVDPPDLVLLDVYMPNVDGVQAFINITAEHLATRVIAISGGGVFKKDDALAIMRDLGAEGVLEKPIEVEELLKAVEQVLRIPR